MQLLVDIQDHKADFVLELLRNLKFVKTKQISQAKYEFMSDLATAVQEVNEIKSGKSAGKPIQNLLDEL